MGKRPHAPTVTRCPTCKRRMTRTSAANRRYWSLLHAIAEKLRPGGQQYPADSYHMHYKSRFLGCDDVKLPSGKVLSIPRSTADLDVQEFDDYMMQVEADANARSVYLEDVEAA